MLTVGHMSAQPFSLSFSFISSFLTLPSFTHLFTEAEAGEEQVTKDPKE